MVSALVSKSTPPFTTWIGAASRKATARASGPGCGGQPPFEMDADLPQLLVGDFGDAVPDGLLIHALAPIFAQIFVEQVSHPAGEPGFGVDAVGDVPDRHFILRQIRPKVVVHFAGHPAVDFGHSVGVAREAQRQHRHAEGFAPGLFVARHIEEGFAIQAQLRPDIAKRISPSARAEIRPRRPARAYGW